MNSVRSHATVVTQQLLRNSNCATVIMQQLLCNIYYATVIMQQLLCNSCYATVMYKTTLTENVPGFGLGEANHGRVISNKLQIVSIGMLAMLMINSV
jgi:hypothetical protein